MSGMLGKVARGVGGAVGGIARSVVFGDGENDGDVDDGGAELLLERIADGVLAADRRAAAIELRDVVQRVPAAQFAVGAMGLPTLVGSLRDERDDPELMHGVLEALTACVTAGGLPNTAVANVLSSSGRTPQPAAPDIGLSVAESFASAPSNCDLVLSLLDDDDFYTRYHAVQLLTALAGKAAHHVRVAVLSSPTGVAKLMDMMLEREVIRNETMLLLVLLTSQSEDLRKIVAFEGAFERCFNIVREEGASDGGIIVRDCLELCSNLLRGSSSNQSFFRESGFLARLPETIASKTPAASSSNPPTPLATQKAANLLCALELATALIADGDTREAAQIRAVSKNGIDATVAAEIETRDASAKKHNRELNQQGLLKAGMLQALLKLCLGDKAVHSAPVRAFALRCLGDLVSESRPNQDVLFASAVQIANRGGDDTGAQNTTNSSVVTEPALLAALRVALRGEDAGERVAAETLFARCLFGNPELQLVCVSTFAPVGDDDVSLGALLARALVGKNSDKKTRTQRGDDEPSGGAPSALSDLEISCHAAAVLRHVLAGNRAAQARILSIPLEMPTSTGVSPPLLLPRLVKFLSAAQRQVPAALEVGDETRAARRDELPYGRYGGGGDFALAEQAAAVATTQAARRRVERTQATLLRVLIAWLHGCAPAVRAFLAPAAHLPTLVDLARSDSVHVAGLAVVLLGCCLVSGDDVSETVADVEAAAGVLDVIVARLGLDEFFGRWDAMRACPEFQHAERRRTLAAPLTRVTANRLASGVLRDENFETQFTSDLYDTGVAKFVMTFEQTVKERVISLYARPKGAKGASTASASAAATWDAAPNETPGAHCQRLKGLLRGQTHDLEAQRARNAVLAERLMHTGSSRRGAGAGDTSHAREDTERDNTNGSAAHTTSHGDSESAELRASLERARVASDLELTRTKAELDEARGLVASGEENLRGLAQAYNGLEVEMAKRDEECASLRLRVVRLEKSEQGNREEATRKPSEKVTASDLQAQLAIAREEGRRDAISEMARQLEETEEAAAADVAAARTAGAAEAEQSAASAAETALAEMSDLLACLGQEESKTEALMLRLMEKHGETEADLEQMLEEIAGAEEEDDE